MTEEKKVVSIFDAYGSDPDKEVKGVWEDLVYLPGAKVLVARFGNPDSRRLLRRLQEPHTRGRRPGHAIPDDVQEAILNQVVSETLLLDWKGIFAPNEAGEIIELPYSKQNALMLLKDPRLKDFRDEIVLKANAFELFKAEQDEESADNLGK